MNLLGPDRLTKPTQLVAKASSKRARVVAVTFLLDGRPLGSDTTAPHSLDVDPALLPAGNHRLEVEAVDSMGGRTRTKPATVTVAPSGSRIVEASPGRTFSQARKALERGDVTVLLAPGRYEVDELQLGSGARLVGSGPRTVLHPRTGAHYWALVVARGRNIRISDLTIDGGGPLRGGSDDGIAVAVFDGSRDVRLQRLHITRVRTDGVNTWGAHADVSVQDSRIESRGTADAGVVALGSDASRDTSVIRTRVRGFTSFGILLQQQKYGHPAADLHGVVLDNLVSDIRDPRRDGCWTAAKSRTRGCGTNEGGIWTGGVEAAVIGNTVVRARWDGIETVGSSTRTTIVENEIRNTRTGIYLEHSTNDSVIAHNLIVDTEAGIQVEWRYDGVGSSRNTFVGNRIVDAKAAGLIVDTGGDRNRIVRNEFVGGARPAIALYGSSENVVRDNVGCGGTRGVVVGMESARFDDGSAAHSRNNRVAGNRSVASC